MAVVFLEGFDKYGPAYTGSFTYPDTEALLTAGEWTGQASTNGIVRGLSQTGYALQTSGDLVTNNLFKTLPANYPTLIFGVRFNVPALQLNVSGGNFYFYDGGNCQASVGLNYTGRISVYSGTSTPPIATTTGPVFSAGVTHYLEVQMTFSPTGNYVVYVDGVNVLSGTGNLRAGSANNYANMFAITGSLVGGGTIVDDLYIFDTTGPTNNAPLLTSPRVETSFPISDAQTQFTNGASLIGNIHYDSGPTAGGPSANQLALTGPFQSGQAVSMNSLSAWTTTTSATAKIKGVIYTDTGNKPSGGSLVATTTETVGVTSGQVTCTFAAPVSIPANTPYWLGFIGSATVNLRAAPAGVSIGYIATNTYTSGAPATCPTMSSDYAFAVWGNCTGSTKNWISENISGPPGDFSYINSSVVGTEDLYNMTPLSTTPAAIYAVGTKVYAKRSDSGARTVDVRTKSGATDSGGSQTLLVPGTSYTWCVSYLETNPNTGTAWTKTTVDAAAVGPKVSS